MPKTDRRVDALIAKSADFAKPILKHLRKLIHAGCPQVEETIKWGFASFVYNGTILCQMAAFKKHCSYGFWHRDMHRKMKEATGVAGHFRNLVGVDDLPKDAVLIRLIKEAAKLNESDERPARAPRKPAKALAVPKNLAAALRGNAKAGANFKSLSTSHRNEYIDWITQAKRAETREKRLATTIEWLEKGKSRNWKYER
jgi:uncharacterized protein YdeI (YjbR/CyaY-like superfamily)